MNCKKIRELLLTDYLDKEADITLKYQVQKHLENCRVCRRFEEKARLAIAPFKSAPPSELPESVWYSIKGKIAQSHMPRESVFDFLREKLKIFYAPKPAFALASAMLIILAMATAVAKYTSDKNQVRDYFAQQIGFYAMLDNGEENGTQSYF